MHELKIYVPIYRFLVICMSLHGAVRKNINKFSLQRNRIGSVPTLDMHLIYCK